MPMPTKVQLTGVLFAQENLRYVQKSTKYISIADFLVKSYDKASGKVVFADLLKFTATNSVIASIFREKYEGVENRITYEQTKLLNVDLHSLSYFCHNYYNNYDEKPLRDIMTHTGFFKDLVLYSLYKHELVEASDETIESLLKSINNQVPDYLCDLVDEITDVDLLDVETIKKCIKLFDYYVVRKEMIKLFSHNSSYDKAENKLIATQLKEYFKFVNDNKS